MSRSRRKPWIKDKPRNQKRTSLYWRSIRRVWGNEIKSSKFWDEDFSFTDRKVIYNQYNYCDYTFIVYEDRQKDNRMKIFRGWTKKDVEKYSRK